MHSRRLRFVQVMLLSVLLAAGSAASAAPITTLTVANDANSICNAPMFVGVAKGMFHKYGLDIRMHPAANGFVSLREVNQGSAEIGAAAPSVVAQLIGQGAPLKGIFTGCGDATGTIATDDIAEIVARRTSGIREGHIEDLRGKKIGLGGRGTVNNQYLFAALAAKGLDPLTAVTVVVMPPAELPRALGSGAVDAVATGVVAGLEILRSVGDAFVVQRGGNVMQYVILRVARLQYLTTHPGTLKRYIAAFAEAAQFVRIHPGETTDILTADRKGTSRETVQAEVASLHSDIRVTRATARAVRQSIEFVLRIDALSRAPTFEDMVDFRLLRQVEREHPAYFRDLPPIPAGETL